MPDTTPELTDQYLAELERLCEKATPGPWATYAPSGGEYGKKYESMGVRDEQGAICMSNQPGWAYPEQWDNGSFIAASRAALPALIAEVRRLRVAVATCESNEMAWPHGPL